MFLVIFILKNDCANAEDLVIIWFLWGHLEPKVGTKSDLKPLMDQYSHGNVAILQPLLSNIKYSIISRLSRDDGTDVLWRLSNDL